jgi:hypothetical protein
VRSVLLAVLLLALPSWGATIYIGAAAGTQSGADCANARARTSLVAGDWVPDENIHLCGILTGQLAALGSGTAGHPISIIFETGANMSSAVWSGSTGAINLNSRSYMIVDGGTNGIIENSANGSGLANHIASRGISADGCNNCEIKNLTIRNIYLRTSTSDTSIDQTAMTAVHFSGSNWLIHDNTIHNAGWALEQFWANGDSNVRIYNNNIYNVDHGWVPAGVGVTTASDFYFYNNHVHDFANWDSGAANTYHHDGVHAFGSTGATATQIWIYNNTFDGDIGGNATGYIFMEGGSGAGSTPWADGTGVVRIFNNIFSATTETVFGLVQVHAGGTALIFNNAIQGNSSSTCLDVSNVGSVSSENNIIQSCATLVYLHGGAVLSTVDYNLYAASGSNALVFNTTFVPQSSIATWRTTCSCDTHAITSTPTVSVTTSLAPLSTGSAAGANLLALGYTDLNSDILDNPRPGVAAWDMGPFQYLSPTTPVIGRRKAIVM